MWPIEFGDNGVKILEYVYNKQFLDGIKLWPCLEAVAVTVDRRLDDRVRKQGGYHEPQDPATSSARIAQRQW